MSNLRSTPLIAFIVCVTMTAVTANATCWQVVGWVPFSGAQERALLNPADCSVTPTGYGWRQLDPIYLLIRTDEQPNRLKYLQYRGHDANGPIVQWDVVVGLGQPPSLEDTPPVSKRTVNVNGHRQVIATDAANLFWISTDGELMRTAWLDNDWWTLVIPHYGASLAPGSLVKGHAWDRVYGTNVAGEVFNTWNDNGTIRFDILAGTSGILAGSLIVTSDVMLYGVTTAGDIARMWWSGRWNFEHIATWGVPVVPTSLTKREASTVFGVNSKGQLIGLWVNDGRIVYGILDPKYR